MEVLKLFWKRLWPSCKQYFKTCTNKTDLIVRQQPFNFWRGGGLVFTNYQGSRNCICVWWTSWKKCQPLLIFYCIIPILSQSLAKIFKSCMTGLTNFANSALLYFLHRSCQDLKKKNLVRENNIVPPPS